jgi:tetratricopeptide (TPR) repeat protein
MKKYVILVLMLSVGAMAFGQSNKTNNKTTNKTENKPAANQSATNVNPPATQQQTTQQQQQLNPLVSHYLMKYNVAVRFNDMATAKDALYDLIVENPANDSLFLNLAVMYYDARQYASTILVSQELLARNAKNTTAIELAAASFEALNIYDKALQHYESLYLQTNGYPSLYKMAFLQFDLKRYNECSATSDILLSKKEADELKVSYNISETQTKEFPIKVAVLNLKGMVARESGDKINAKKFFEQALALAPDFPQAKDNLAKLK